MAYAEDFEKALQVGRPPNVRELFPNSRALLVSGKAVDRAMRAKGDAIAMAANGRNSFVIRGALRAAQRANAALIIEIAKSEGGQKAYCAVNYWNMARIVDSLCNEMGITIPVAVHADHYGIKNDQDLEQAMTEIPSLFEAGITSIAIDASHQPNDKNLLANLAVNPHIPSWAGLETEIGEIKGKEGLSTPDEALYLIQGLNAHGIFAVDVFEALLIYFFGQPVEFHAAILEGDDAVGVGAGQAEEVQAAQDGDAVLFVK